MEGDKISDGDVTIYDIIPYLTYGLKMEMVPANIWRFGFSLYKNIFLVLVSGFSPWYFVLIIVKSFHIEISLYNIHSSPRFEGLKSNILHITMTKFNMNQFYKN